MPAPFSAICSRSFTVVVSFRSASSAAISLRCSASCFSRSATLPCSDAIRSCVAFCFLVASSMMSVSWTLSDASVARTTRTTRSGF